MFMKKQFIPGLGIFIRKKHYEELDFFETQNSLALLATHEAKERGPCGV